MRDVPIPFDEVRDPQGLNMPDKNLSRDPCRTPMQWTPQKNAGFSKGKPWLRIDKEYKLSNVEHEKIDPNSILSLYKKLIKLRNSEPALSIGRYVPVRADSQSVSYIREISGEYRFLVVLNLSHRPCYFKPPLPLSGRIVVSTSPSVEGDIVEGYLDLYGNEAVVIRLDK
ncbi:MAG TPA: DUF3459 domain-containing protein [Mucilaginibacter sp.]|nr:DUF3459 domain-containing protein [Mucilaginibacter sp.]